MLNGNTFTSVKEKAINKRIGEHLRMIRLGQNLSLEALADELELSVSTMSNLERGTTGITVERLYQILVILKTDVMDFFAIVQNIPRNHTAAEGTDISRYSSVDLAEEIRKIRIEIETLKRGK